MILRATCLIVLLSILAAGLWPFHAPGNKVSWLRDENGLRFDKYSSIVTAGEFTFGSSQGDVSCTIEIWPEPTRLHASGTILSFYRPQSHVAPFAVRQSWGDLVLEKSAGPSQPAERTKVYVDNIFARQKSVFLAISSSPAGTLIFADGILVKQLSSFHFSIQDLTGRLLLGNSPFSTHEWRGELRGLAIYDRALTPREAAQHYVDWTKSNNAQPPQREHAIALYLFDEHGGNIAHNRAASSTDLTIPERFFILHEQFLARPWDEYRREWSYWKDIGINIAGFIPLGFFFFPYFLSMRRVKYPIAAAIAFGFAVSLTIEVWQSFLPTRNSGMTDLFTNTLGTAIGVFVFQLNPVQSALAAVGILPGNETVSQNADHPVYEMVPVGADSSR